MRFIIPRPENRPEYGNWVSKRIILHQAILVVVFGVLGSFWSFFHILTVFFSVTTAYFLYARYLFSPIGANVQEKIRGIILDNLEWDGHGKALDIGCGSGALPIRIAQKFSTATVFGTDSWGSNWEYSEKICEINARLEYVGDRVFFQEASAPSLPFMDGEFDAVVSNLVFHEVKGVRDKVGLIKEALRVLRKGGKFALQDLFYIERLFGKPENLVETIRTWGIEKVEFVKTKDAPFLPVMLKLPFMVGTLGLLKGQK